MILSEELSELKEEIKDEIKQFKDETNKSLEALWKAHNEAMKASNDLQKETNNLVTELAKSNGEIKVLIYEKFAKQSDLDKVENELKCDINELGNDLNSKINECNTNRKNDLKEHIQKDDDNKWRLWSLAIGIPSGLVAAIEGLKAILK